MMRYRHSEDLVIEMRARYRDGETVAAIARALKVPYGTVYDTCVTQAADQPAPVLLSQWEIERQLRLVFPWGEGVRAEGTRTVRRRRP